MGSSMPSTCSLHLNNHASVGHVCNLVVDMYVVIVMSMIVVYDYMCSHTTMADLFSSQYVSQSCC